ncbi:YPR147C [Saccharomyces arboricola H-6]|uniref:YPR147C n=1 Tax=Saccharomyces arboricola (strain H-6 / AS 2.3317 / CBS 10644) TaxID=1160507 RepID=J8PXW7_SACAR|nr:YPR147C [Saccharomyces arboricola H-6]
MSIQEYSKSKLPCSILNIKPTVTIENKDAPLMVWIPGNPGLLYYYQEMLQHLHVKHPDWEILSVSHAGMTLIAHSNTPIFSLQDQVDHQVEVINNFSRGNRKIIIMGHSVGAYILQKVCLSNKLVGSVEKVGLITPTVMNIHTSEMGTKLTTALHHVPSLAHVVSLFSYIFFYWILSEGVSKFIIDKFMGCGSTGYQAVLSTRIFLTHRQFVRQSLGLASQEMEEITTNWEFQDEFITYCEENGIFIWFLFSTKDHWVAENTRSHLSHYYKDKFEQKSLRIDVTDKIPHSFVVKHAEYTINAFF